MTPALVAYLLVKDNFVVQTLLYELITLSALAAACVGVIRYRPPRPRLSGLPQMMSTRPG